MAFPGAAKRASDFGVGACLGALALAALRGRVELIFGAGFEGAGEATIGTIMASKRAAAGSCQG